MKFDHIKPGDRVKVEWGPIEGVVKAVNDGRFPALTVATDEGDHYFDSSDDITVTVIKMQEPTNLGAVVLADTGRWRWWFVNIGGGSWALSKDPGYPTNIPEIVDWYDLTNPTPVEVKPK